LRSIIYGTGYGCSVAASQPPQQEYHEHTGF
jgi:hypothetical protein